MHHGTYRTKPWYEPCEPFLHARSLTELSATLMKTAAELAASGNGKNAHVVLSFSSPTEGAGYYSLCPRSASAGPWFRSFQVRSLEPTPLSTRPWLDRSRSGDLGKTAVLGPSFGSFQTRESGNTPCTSITWSSVGRGGGDWGFGRQSSRKGLERRSRPNGHTERTLLAAWERKKDNGPCVTRKRSSGVFGCRRGAPGSRGFRSG